MATRSYVKSAELPSYGPSWLDVGEQQDRLKELVGLDVTFQTSRVRSVNGRLGFYTRLFVGGRLVEGIGVGYGPSHANSPKTFPAALYTLLQLFEDLRDSLTPLERLARWGELWEAGDPE